MRKTILAAGAAVIALGTVAYAAPGADTAEPMTRAEAQTRAAAMFERMDANNDGQIDAADREARRMAMFDRMDSDDNGAISREEFAAKHRRGGHGGNHERMGHGEGQHAQMGHKMGRKGGGRGMGGMMLRMADADGNGAVTRTEFDAAVQQHFAQMDSDNNGTVSAAEHRAAREKMREMHQQHRANSAD